jgi:WD40 repeat protein
MNFVSSAQDCFFVWYGIFIRVVVKTNKNRFSHVHVSLVTCSLFYNAWVKIYRWNPHIPGLLASGCNNSWVLLYNSKAKQQKTLQVKDRTTSVVDMQWDRLSSVYLLVAYQSFISLWDTDSLSEIHAFDKQPGGITSIAWLDWTAGNFVSSNAKTGILRVWNASQRQAIDSIRVAASGINRVYFGVGTKRALCACVDGTLVVYHMVKMQVEFCSSAGHTETIFDCSLSPASPDVLATASYDTTGEYDDGFFLLLKRIT